MMDALTVAWRLSSSGPSPFRSLTSFERDVALLELKQHRLASRGLSIGSGRTRGLDMAAHGPPRSLP
jgi:hypothetical protein